MQAIDKFFDVPREKVKTTKGEVELPILYYELEILLALFLVDKKPAEKLLSAVKLKPVEVPLGKTIAGLAFYRYDHTTVGTYNEVGLGIAAVPQEQVLPLLSVTDFLRRTEKRRLGFYITDLPVTTPEANAAGREIWGYPKFVTKLPMEFSDNGFKGGVFDPSGGEICTLSGSMRTWLKLPAFDLVTYTLLNGERIRTTIDVRGSFSYGAGWGLKLQVGSSEHVMAARLKELGFDGKSPLLVARSTSWQSRLNKGVSG
ncbi:MAG: hypothetical protein LDLANPLL_02063 [Turneriella sp.]|nr:hypothetical protein [Turneriella sp.]